MARKGLHPPWVLVVYDVELSCSQENPDLELAVWEGMVQSLEEKNGWTVESVREVVIVIDGEDMEEEE